MRFTQIHRFSARLLSTVHRGTAFEKRALALLTEHMSMSLTRVGGSHDGGIDLIGWWWIPTESSATCASLVLNVTSKVLPAQKSLSRVWPYIRVLGPPYVTAKPKDWNAANRRRLRVLAQCKAEKRKMGPGYLRELEGVAYRYTNDVISTGPIPDPSNPKGSYSSHSTTTITTAMAGPSQPPPTVALLVSESAFTRNCLLAAHASPLPFLLVHIPPDESDALAGAIFGNPALISSRGVLKGQLEIRWEHSTMTDAPRQVVADDSHGVGASLSGRPGLWWQGQPLASWTPDGGVDGLRQPFAY
jgi:Protein of unknown function (DUF2034)